MVFLTCFSNLGDWCFFFCFSDKVELFLRNCLVFLFRLKFGVLLQCARILSVEDGRNAVVIGGYMVPEGDLLLSKVIEEPGPLLWSQGLPLGYLVA